MNRRRFLAGLSTAAGASLFAPFMRQAFGAEAPPRRFVFVVEGNGIHPSILMSPAVRATIDGMATAATTDKLWFPTLYGHTTPQVVNSGDLGAALALDPLLAGVGVDLVGKSAVVLGLSSTVTGGGHSTFFGALSSTRSTQARPAGATIDAVLAALPDVRRETPFDAVRVGVHSSSDAMNTSTCAFAAAKPAPILMDPTLAFNNLFGSVADDAGRAAFARRAGLLDYAHADVTAALAAFSGASAERAKLEAYLTSLEVLQAQQQRLVDLEPVLSAVAPAAPSLNPLYSSLDPFDHLQAQFDLVAAALLGGLTNVAVIGSGTGYGFDLAYPSLIADLARHTLQHEYAFEPSYLDVIHAASRQHVVMIAGLARALDAVPEDGGTMLDHTLIVYLSDNGESHHSSAEEWPVLLVGGGAMGFQTDGRTTGFPGVRTSTNRQLSNLFNTLGHAAGHDLNTFGLEGAARIAEGPLSELWSPV